MLVISALRESLAKPLKAVLITGDTSTAVKELPRGTPVGMISVDDLLAHTGEKLIGLAGIVAQQVRSEDR